MKDIETERQRIITEEQLERLRTALLDLLPPLRRLEGASLLGVIRDLEHQAARFNARQEPLRTAPGDDYWGQAYNDAGYTWCRICREYQRPPECIGPLRESDIDTPISGG